VRRAAPTSVRPSDQILRASLERSLSQFYRRPRTVRQVTRRPSVYRSSFALENLDVEFATGETLEVVFKDLSPGALSEEGKLAKPAFLLSPEREIEAYRKILGPYGIGAPACYGAVVEPAHDRYWLFLERVPGVELYQVGEIEVWARVARWLSAYHQTLAPHVVQLSRDVPLIQHDAGYYDTWRRRGSAALSSSGPHVDPVGSRRLLAWLPARYPRLVARLMDLPVTVIHGELYASSVLVDVIGEATSVRAVDWEIAAAGPGLVDLAALTSGDWTEARRTEIAQAYWEHSVASGTEPWAESFSELTASLDLCRLQLAIQWLGWSSAWVPPPQQTHDWMAEAIQLIERVEI
jgi:hypothetical protein